MKHWTSLIALALLTTACNVQTPDEQQNTQAATEETAPQDRFFAALSSHCGKAYEGRLVSQDEADADMADERLVMHVRGCEGDVLHIPFHVGDDASRTWVLTRTGTGLRLKHDHRHEDGSEDAVTMYGGDTDAPGTATRQEFPVDRESIDLFKREGLDRSVTNVWAVEITDEIYAYELRRPAGPDERFFRVEFDLTEPIAAPPPPWGHE